MEKVTNVAEYAAGMIEMLRSSEEYRNYHALLKKVMQNPELYDKINVFRKQSFAMTFTGEIPDDKKEGSQEPGEELGTILNNRTIADFLRSERSLCQMVRQINYAVVEAADLDVSFLD